uniref:Protein bunched, class 1/class 3/D/E isoform n=1 Tax=Ascaris suum TaxID=6253 RepID=F1LF37_ASCSU
MNLANYVWLSKEALIFPSAKGPGPGGTSQMVAIDSKIEQAMDLVKTHLMFAVREEVEVLRAKIIELETTVLQLEAENAILREHVPTEILNKLSLQTAQGPVATAAV